MPSSQGLTELTPIMLDDNTVVKVPVSAESRDHPTVSRDHNTVDLELPSELRVQDSVDPTVSDSPVFSGMADGSTLYAGQDIHRSNEADVNSDDIDFSALFTQIDSLEDGSQKPTITETQLKTLVNYYNSYPRTYFKNALVTLYASCDRKLEEVRKDLFILLCSKPEFPYIHHSLKRRIQTRGGVSLVDKLALDVHTLVSALADETYENPDLKEMFSSSRKSAVSISTPHRPTTSPQAPITDTVSRSEFETLKDSIITVKSDVLTLQQTLKATEKARSTEIQEFDNSLKQIGDEMDSFKNEMCLELKNIMLVLSRIESVENLSLAHIKNDIKVMKQDLRSCESNINMMDSKVQKIVTQTNKQSRGKRNPTDNQTRVGGKLSVESLPRVAEDRQRATEPSGGALLATTASSLQSSIIRQNNDRQEYNYDKDVHQSVGARTGKTVTSNRNLGGECDRFSLNEFPSLPSSKQLRRQTNHENVSSFQKPVEENLYSNVAASNVVYQDPPARTQPHPVAIGRGYNTFGRGRGRGVTIGRASNSQTEPRAPHKHDSVDYVDPLGTTETIPQDCSGLRGQSDSRSSHMKTQSHPRTSFTYVHDYSSPCTNDDDFDLSGYVRKRTRRFFVGGFDSSITENIIAQFVCSKGPKVTNVEFFNKRNNNLVIRVNVENDENAEKMTEPYFWPEGIACRPWVTRAQYMARMNGTKPNPVGGGRRYFNREYRGRAGSGPNSNRFEPLSGID